MIQPTDESSVFQQLHDYISEFDREWWKKIIPASETMIESLKIVSEIQRKSDDFPPLYKMFLEHMGRNDGGLLSVPLNGTSNIIDIIDLYEEFHKFTPEVFCTPYFAFFQKEMGGELSFNISNPHEENILDTDCGEIFRVNSESFKKLLFQSAIIRFERFKNYIRFSGTLNNLKEAMLISGENSIIHIIDGVLAKYGLTKAWFSDRNHYIALGVETSLYVQKTYGVIGFITSNNTDISKKLVEDLSKKLGVTIKTN